MSYINLEKTTVSTRLNIIIGVTVLFIGTLVYLTDRPADATVFVNRLMHEVSLFGKIPLVFGAVGKNLPGFCHVLAFSLLTAVFFASGKKSRILVCSFWAGINILFELGQKYSTTAVDLLPGWMEKLPVLNHVDTFFIRGTYDRLDMLAYIAGGLSAYAILTFTGKRS